jgi:hypothetical protein
MFPLILILYIFRAIVLYTHVYSQLVAQLILMFLHVSAAQRSHFQGAASIQGLHRVLQVVKYNWSCIYTY